MPPSQNGKYDLNTSLDDDLFVELTELLNQKIVSYSLWDESLADELDSELESAPDDAESSSDDTPLVDLDLYLEGGVYFEMYGVACFPDLESEPLANWFLIESTLARLVHNGVWLDDVAVDDDEQLVLVLTHQHQAVLYLVVGGWLIDEWEELPD